MVNKEVRIIKKIINEKLIIKGKCKLLSKGSKCDCPKCQIDNMDDNELKKLVNSFIDRGYDGREQELFL